MVCPLKTETEYAYCSEAEIPSYDWDNAETGSCYYSGNSSFTSNSSAHAHFQKRGMPFFSGVITVSITIRRYYSSEWGRWISRDPIVELGGWNLYNFLLNDPMSWIDILGLGKEEFYDLMKKVAKGGRNVGTVIGADLTYIAITIGREEKEASNCPSSKKGKCIKCTVTVKIIAGPDPAKLGDDDIKIMNWVSTDENTTIAELENSLWDKVKNRIKEHEQGHIKDLKEFLLKVNGKTLSDTATSCTEACRLAEEKANQAVGNYYNDKYKEFMAKKRKWGSDEKISLKSFYENILKEYDSIFPEIPNGGE